MNRATYEKLITEDLEWLAQQPSTLERLHIECVLKYSAAEFSARESSPRVERVPSPDPHFMLRSLVEHLEMLERGGEDGTWAPNTTRELIRQGREALAGGASNERVPPLGICIYCGFETGREVEDAAAQIIDHHKVCPKNPWRGALAELVRQIDEFVKENGEADFYTGDAQRLLGDPEMLAIVEPESAPVVPVLSDLAGLVSALRSQRQVDEDGVEVGVSRQAVDEAADFLEAWDRSPDNPANYPPESPAPKMDIPPSATTTERAYAAQATNAARYQWLRTFHKSQGVFIAQRAGHLVQLVGDTADDVVDAAMLAEAEPKEPVL